MLRVLVKRREAQAVLISRIHRYAVKEGKLALKMCHRFCDGGLRARVLAAVRPAISYCLLIRPFNHHDQLICAAGFFPSLQPFFDKIHSTCLKCHPLWLQAFLLLHFNSSLH
jgi:hypothetical protein